MTEPVSAGATPVVDGATPPQTTPAPQPAAEPATGADAALGDAGKRALDAMKAERNAEAAARKRAEAELEQLRTSQMGEHEKAIAQARREAASETEKAWGARLRASEVRRELQAAGMQPDLIGALATSPEFAAVAIEEDGSMPDLPKAVAAFRTAHPSAFAAPRQPAGNFDGGSGGSPALQSWTAEQIGAMSQGEFEKNEAEIMRAMREGRIRPQ
jgi:hypothetical protein